MTQRPTWVIIVLILVIIAGAAGFFVGNRFGTARAAGFAGDRAAFLRERLGDQGVGLFGGQGTRNGARGVVESINGDIVLVNGPQGLITVHLAQGTRIYKSVEGVSTDLKMGETVVVTGEANPDGSVSATDVLIQPELLGP